MSITTNCFLKFSPPPPPPTSESTKPNSHAKPRNILSSSQSERPLATRCVAGIACAVIGLQLAGSIQRVESLALAIGDPNSTSVAQTQKWSDKRTCPAWQVNSLETIVPENLPRPSAKRRWEIVGFEADPATVRIRVFRNGNGCFSM
uniref:Uncharacterized protein n=1 Tax=Kalanchoe fedtschenkoi TaxID=63787 RepID=A0A7N0TA31_KALFE